MHHRERGSDLLKVTSLVCGRAGIQDSCLLSSGLSYKRCPLINLKFLEEDPSLLNKQDAEIQLTI
jgi:hypothetical protein